MRALTICFLMAGFGLTAVAAESRVKVEELPAAVQTSMKEHTKGATILGASKEREHGRMIYEVETKLDGKSRDLSFDDKGSLLEVEQEIDLDSIPAPAKEAIQKKLPGATIKKVESVTHGSITSYEADVRTKAGRNQEVAVNADGSAHTQN